MNNLPRDSHPLLVFDQLTVSYPSSGGRAVVLNNFSWGVAAGKFLAVVGPSGCGKSTLLNVAAGFIRPDSGSIRLNGQQVVKPSLEIGFVSQSYVLFEWLTVEKNIAFGLRYRNLSDREINKKVNHLLEVTGLAQQRDYYPAQLSGGMQQRVALARSIAPEPQVLLLDEPFSALDTGTRIRMRALLLQLWTEHKTTILFVTHDIEEALFLSDSVLMLDKNKNAVGELNVPYIRPRQYTLVHTEEFQGMVEKISGIYGPFFT